MCLLAMWTLPTATLSKRLVCLMEVIMMKEEERRWQVVFSLLGKRNVRKKNREPETISTGARLSAQAMEFMESVCIDDVAWTVEGDRKTMALNQAGIITKMVLNNIGKKRSWIKNSLAKEVMQHMHS